MNATSTTPITTPPPTPAPCGYHGDPVKECSRTAMAIARYQKKISGPLLGRIDIHIEVPRVYLRLEL